MHKNIESGPMYTLPASNKRTSTKKFLKSLKLYPVVSLKI